MESESFSTLRLLVILMNPCLPANTGGKIDPWTRAKAMKKAGCKLFLVTWEPHGTLAAETRAELELVFDEIRVYSTGSDLMGLLKRIRNLPMSPHISSRYLLISDQTELEHDVRSFGADAIWLDSLYGSGLAINLSRNLSLPLFYRSHNIEHLYMRSQADQARSLRNRIAWRLATFRLSKVEHAVQNYASHVFEISRTDMEYWRGEGIKQHSWLPTFLDPSEYDRAREAQRSSEFDFGFVGNLSSPNNQRSIEWFLDRVWPIVHRSHPKATVMIAGMKPSSFLSEKIQKAGAQLFPDPSSAPDAWARAHTFFNPITTGSGINVKTVEMLMFDAPLVSTSVGVRGLPVDVAAEFHLADDAEMFAAKMIEARYGSEAKTDTRLRARGRFDVREIEKLVAMIRSFLVRPAADGFESDGPISPGL